MKRTKRKSKAAARADAPASAVAKSDVPATPVFVLSSHCTIKDAAALKLDLANVADAADVTIDVGSVERIDTAVMQLLCAFVRDRTQREQRVSWQGDSQAWREAVHLLGTRELLGLAPEGACS